ncbi:MAG: metallophosphoesterase family protein [Candidatus Omnitrophica bacterium]|nr:metallophosphoesterase family protein [Candidatus Omnitrophota bacterium]
MRIGVISDTHIPAKAKEIPKEVLEAFKKVDMVIHAGDLVDLSVLDQLKEVCPNVLAVYGNMDPEAVSEKLPQRIVLNAGNFKIGVTHGSGSPDSLMRVLSEIFKHDKVDVIIFGHSHEAFNEKIKGVLFFNPGSATDKIIVEYNSYGIIQINGTIEAKIIRL